MVLVEKICFRLREETNQTEIGQFLNDTQSMEIYRQNHFSGTEFIFFSKSIPLLKIIRVTCYWTSEAVSSRATLAPELHISKIIKNFINEAY